MSAHADHDHDHGAAPSHKLAVAFFVSLAVFVLEVAGGIASHSLALLSDAGHMLTDVLALGLAWFASTQAERPASLKHTYGFHRVGILAALANAATLVLLALFITYEAYHRLSEPQAVATELMLGVAVVGLVANLGVAWYLRAQGSSNLNLRAALAHVLGDALASTIVIVGAVAIALGSPTQIDPLLSVLIGFIIMASGWSIIRDTLNILMEGAPPGVDVGKVMADIRGLPGVVAIHDVHVWSLAAGMPALSAHVRIDHTAHTACDRVLGQVQLLLAERYGIVHNTIQVERADGTALCAPDLAGVGCGPQQS